MRMINTKKLGKYCFFSLLIIIVLSSCTNAQNQIQIFEIYGRHNLKLKDSTRIMLSYTTDDETFMQIGELNKTKPKLQRIHYDIHCLNFPEVFSTIQNIDTLSFASLPYFQSKEKNYVHKIYTYYNIEKYNDLIVYYHTENSINELSRNYNVNTSPDFELYTVKYNNSHEEFDSDAFKSMYVLDENRKVYFDRLNYKEGEENAQDYDYNNQNLLFIYKKMKKFKVIKSEILMNNKSIFKDNCQNRE